MPQSVKTSAIVLRRADWREADRIVTLFSPTMGRVEALVRGCRRQKSPLMMASEPFSSGEYVLWQGGERMTVTSWQQGDCFYPLREDYERLCHGTYWLELLLFALQPDQENERLFLLLLRSLAHLAYGKAAPRRVSAIFLMGMVSLMGFRPSVGRCQRCGKPLSPEEGAFLSPEAGGCLCRACHTEGDLSLSARDLLLLQGIMRRGLTQLEEEGAVSDALFSALCRLAETRLDAHPRSGALLM